MIETGDKVTVVRGRLRGEGGQVTGVHDEYGQTVVVFESDYDGRRRSCQIDRVRKDYDV